MKRKPSKHNPLQLPGIVPAFLIVVVITVVAYEYTPGVPTAPHPAEALVREETECMDALANGLAKVTDESTASDAIPQLKPYADRLTHAQTELARVTREQPAWMTSGVRAQGSTLMNATSKFQQEMVRVAMIPGTSKLLQTLSISSK